MFIKVDNLKKDYGTSPNITHALRGVSFEAEKGEIIVLLGPSGSGKSTLLNIIGGIETSDEGTILINDELVNQMNAKQKCEYRRKHLGFIFQSYNLIANLTVKENIETGAYLSRNHLDVDELIETLDIKEEANKLPSQLSGGQQQRVAIGRAIVKNPDLLLCDEPTGALDSENSLKTLVLIEKVSKIYNTTVLMVTHNEVISNMADRIIRFKDGEVFSNIKNENKVNAKDLVL